jgi:hypothetical protein
MKKRHAGQGARKAPDRFGWHHRVLGVLAILYLSGLWLDGIGSGLPRKILPRPALYFVQVAGLFTGSVAAAIDYRAQAWLCDDRRWVELDTRPYFPINRDDKENRFHRSLHFFGQHRPTLQALESYLIGRHERSGVDDGLPHGARVGGVRLVRLRHAIPEPGQPPELWHRRPLVQYPDTQRTGMYWTPRSRRAQKCGGLAPLPSEDR